MSTSIEASPPAPAGPAGPGRLEAIDAVRGLVMIVMALDHVRDFVHRGAMTGSPTDLATTTPGLFLTRWITHICAPTFMLTAGLGAYYWWRRGRTRRELSTFLLTRGLWLIVLELTVMRVAYFLNPFRPDPILLLVLWVLGLCMVVLAALVWLPRRALLVSSLIVIALHNLLDGVNPAQLGSAAGLWNLLHQPGALRVGDVMILVAYPLVPWVAVMALGFSLGPVFERDRADRRRLLALAGVACVVGFLILRALNVYGDPIPWTPQPSPIYTILSFLNTTKYPPSLAFLLMTLGPALLALAWFDRPAPRPPTPFLVFGRVPLFYFVLHFFAAHAAAVILALVRYGGRALGFAFLPVPSMGGPRDLFPPDFGFDLWVTYLVWAVIVIGLYPLCRRFASIKATRRDWWVSYL